MPGAPEPNQILGGGWIDGQSIEMEGDFGRQVGRRAQVLVEEDRVRIVRGHG